MNQNKYGSLSDTFIATDLYNLPLPVLPPADLSIAAAVFVPSYLFFRMGGSSKVVGFSKTDKPFIRGLGMFSNLAAGLVDKASAHSGADNSWRVKYQMERFGAALTGTLSNTAGSAAVGGTLTSFTTEVAVGSVLVWTDENGRIRSGTVLAVADDTHLTLTAVTTNANQLTGNTVLATAYPLIGNAGTSVDIPFITLNTVYPFDFFLGDVSKVYPPEGTITTTATSAAVVGKGTAFTTDFVVGQPFAWGTGANRRTGVIATLVDATHLTLTAVADIDQSNVAMLDYDNHLRIKCTITKDFNAYTVAIAPAFGDGTKRFMIHAMADIEHTFALSASIV